MDLRGVILELISATLLISDKECGYCDMHGVHASTPLVGLLYSRPDRARPLIRKCHLSIRYHHSLIFGAQLQKCCVIIIDIYENERPCRNNKSIKCVAVSDRCSPKSIEIPLALRLPECPS